MTRATICAAIVSLMVTVLGCGESGDQGMYMPPGSPTQSVEAALAFNEGNELRRTEKERAIAHYTEAIEADPKFEMAYYNRALTLAELGELGAAESDLETLKAMKSERVETLEALIAVARDLNGG